MSSSGVTVVGSDAPSDYHVAPRVGTTAHVAGSAAPPPQTALAIISPSVEAAILKKKRGRPRKYGPDGTATVTRALSPRPISSSPPSALPVIDFSSAGKRGKVRGSSSANRQQLENLGNWVACSVGANFTPHIITVNSGEDVMVKIISFSQQGPRAICVLSANGVISSVTLRQPDSSGGTLTYEGRFEILSLSGSFMPTDSGVARSRSGGMSVSLASPDGRVLGGGVAGFLVAAGPVQVVVGSFLTGNHQEQRQQQKQRKPKPESYSVPEPVPVPVAAPVSCAVAEERFVPLPMAAPMSRADAEERLVPIPVAAPVSCAEAEERFGDLGHPKAMRISPPTGDGWPLLPSDLGSRQAGINVMLPRD